MKFDSHSSGQQYRCDQDIIHWSKLPPPPAHSALLGTAEEGPAACGSVMSTCNQSRSSSSPHTGQSEATPASAPGSLASLAPVEIPTLYNREGDRAAGLTLVAGDPGELSQQQTCTEDRRKGPSSISSTCKQWSQTGQQQFNSTHREAWKE